MRGILGLTFFSCFFATIFSQNVTVFPNKTFCLESIVGIDSSSLGFKWKIVGLQKYFDTSVKFYGVVKFKTTLDEIFQLDGNSGDNANAQAVKMDVKLSFANYQTIVGVDLSPKAEIVQGANLQATMTILTRNGNATFSAGKINPPNFPNTAHFRWELIEKDDRLCRRLLDIPQAFSVDGGTILQDPEDQVVSFHFKIMRYTLHDGEFQSGNNYTICT